MLEHIRVLSGLGLLRALVAVVFGLVLLVKAQRLELRDYESSRFTFEAPAAPARHLADLEFDRVAFSLVGAVSLIIALLRTVQGVGALKGSSWARRAGVGLAGFDIVNLTLFPLSTTLGLYGLVVWCHPESEQRFKKSSTVSGRG